MEKQADSLPTLRMGHRHEQIAEPLHRPADNLDSHTKRLVQKGLSYRPLK